MSEPAPLPAEPRSCGKYSRYHRCGGVLGPCVRKPANHQDWHLDASGTAWSPTAEDQTQYLAVRNEVPRCYATAARYLRAWAVLGIVPLATWRACQFHTANDLIGIPIALAVAALTGWFHRTMHRRQGGSQ